MQLDHHPPTVPGNIESTVGVLNTPLQLRARAADAFLVPFRLLTTAFGRTNLARTHAVVWPHQFGVPGLNIHSAVCRVA